MLFRPSADPTISSISPSKNAVHIGKRRLRRQLVSLLEIPDHYWGWYIPAIRAAQTFLKQQSVSVIISSAPPWTAHLIARHLRRKLRIPWIADFRDRWIADAWRRDLPQWRELIDCKLEASCIEQADVVLCISNGMQRQFINRFPDVSPAKFVTLTNGFDNVTCQPNTSIRKSQTVCLHLGDLYGGRRIDTFCQALVALIGAGELDPLRLKVLFVGPTDDSILASAHEIAQQLIESGCIEFRPRVDWREGQRLLSNADVLLIFQGNHPSVPAKFYEYLQTGKPIFAVVEDGDLSEILVSTGSGLWSDPEKPRDIADKFMKALELPVRSPVEMGRLTSLYHFRSLAESLSKIVYQIKDKAGSSSCA